MTGKKGGLGLTGLDKMFGARSKKAPAPVIEARKAEENVGEVAVKDLRPNPYQPRTVFDPDKLQELVESVKHSGVIQPLIVRKKGRQYEIVAGERRWRAAKEAGLSKVPVVVRDYDEATMMEVALVENMQRSDLDPLEEAKGIRNMMDALGLTQEEAAQKLGKSRAAVTNSLRLLKLPPKVQNLVTAGKLTAGQVRPLLGLSQAAQMEKVAAQAVEGGWSARILEEVVKAVKTGKPYHIYMETEKTLIKPEKNSRKGKKKKAGAAADDLDVKAFQEQLIQYLGTRVKIQPDGKKGGRILIEYYGDEDLERLYELLKGPEPVSRRKTSSQFTV